MKESFTSPTYELLLRLLHEIRNPIAFISSNLELMQQMANKKELSKDQEEFQEMLSDCQEGVMRLKSIVEGLEERSGALSTQKEKIDLSHEMEVALKIALTKCSSDKLSVERSYQSSSPFLGYRHQLGQVFSNLIQNAIEAMDGEGRLSIEIEESPKEVHISISDSGKGIEKEKVSHIFTPFFTDKKKGKGLGLALVKELVELHGGEVRVDSEPLKGSKFSLALPRMKEDE